MFKNLHDNKESSRDGVPMSVKLPLHTVQIGN